MAVREKPIVATGDEDAPASTVRVVIADDHALTRGGVACVLDEADGFEVVAEAEDLAGARRKVRGHHPDVLVLDLHLPDGLGLDAIPEIRAERPETQIVVLTMEDQPAYARRALSAGALGFVLKEAASPEAAPRHPVRVGALRDRAPPRSVHVRWRPGSSDLTRSAGERSTEMFNTAVVSVDEHKEGARMFGKVLVGVDGEEGGRDAIALARKLVAQDGELTVAHVFGQEPRDPGTRGGRSVANVRQHAVEVLERACAEAHVEAHVRWRGSSSVGRGLHELAEITETDLLVVGSSRQGLVGRVRLGDHTRAALNGAPCAIAVAPAGYYSQPSPLLREIGVGYDGSAESERALAAARTLATEFGSRLSAFQAVSIPTYMYLGIDAESIDDIVTSARERISALGDVEPHAAYGDPVEELTLYSASLDLLVVGSRSYGPLGRLVHGSTAQHLARTARCPLLVLTRNAPMVDGGDGAGEELILADSDG